MPGPGHAGVDVLGLTGEEEPRGDQKRSASAAGLSSLCWPGPGAAGLCSEG